MKNDNINYGANNNVATVNGGHSLIAQLKTDFNGIQVLDSPNINHCVNVKNLLEFTDSYSKKIASSMFYYPDTNTTANFTEFAEVARTALVDNVGAAGNAHMPAHTPARNANYNAGYAKRKTLLSAGASRNVIIPLNRYGFFSAFKTEICPNGRLQIEVILEQDNNVIFKANAIDAGKFVVTKMVLWIPKINFSSTGTKYFIDRYSSSKKWTYLKERLEIGGATQLRTGTFRITSSIRHPKHVFIWVLNNTKLNSQDHNMFLFNTYNIANNRTFTNAQLEIGNGEMYPKEAFNPTSQISRVYCDLLQYNAAFNDILTGSLMDIDTFQNLYGLIYFDLRNKDEKMGDDVKLEFKYTLSGAPNADYNIFAFILYEETLEVNIVSGKALLKAYI